MTYKYLDYTFAIIVQRDSNLLIRLTVYRLQLKKDTNFFLWKLTKRPVLHLQLLIY